MTVPVRRAVLALVLAVSAALAAGCATAPTGPGGISTEHGPADVAFATDMVPHHRQAVAMSELAATRAGSPDVRGLARRIGATQAPEIGRMTDMLAAWGAPPPAADGSMGSMGSMSGMAGPGEMARLATLSGPAFDQVFLVMMIAHHAGAVDMARAEQDRGVNDEARELAGDVVTTQEAEISVMRALVPA